MTKNSSIATFLDDLASERPTPGGGGAAAVCGAIGAALVSMVANLTIGKKNYEAVSEDLEGRERQGGGAARRADRARSKRTSWRSIP